MKRLLFILPMISQALFAQEIVVEATRIDENRIDLSRTASTIDLSKDQAVKPKTVADALREIPGVEVVRQGAFGQTTSVFIRGARSESTLVLIDGAEANDGMSPGSAFDFSTMSTANIERIEVYRGPQSVRFGAGALGGVINIVTKEGKERPSYRYFGELGSYNTSRGTLSASGKSYAASVDYYSTQGFSAASRKAGNSEADGAKIGTGSVKLGWLPSRTAKIESTFRYSQAQVEIDTHGGRGGDDPNNTSNARQLIAGVNASDRFLDDQLKTGLGIYFSEIDRNGRNKPDVTDATDSLDHFLSENRKVQSETDWILGELHTLRFGLSYRDESGVANSSLNGTATPIPRKNQSVTGEALTYLYESSTWFFDAGFRADQSSTMGSISNYRGSAGRLFPKTGSKAFISYGTGYKLPSLYQLYSTYGDESLKVENSSTAEATAEQKLQHSSTLALTVFENKFRDLIDFSMSSSRYFNISKARSRGFEIQGTLGPTGSTQLAASYTYLESKDENTGLKLLRRPQSTWTTSAKYSRTSYEAYVQYSYMGEREDVDPNSSQRITMGPYGLMSLGGSYQFQKELKAHARVENIFDKTYEEVAGYGTAGRTLQVGISGEF